VSFIITGDLDETAARAVEDDQRIILGRSSVDSFVMAVPRPLGNLTHLRYYIYIILCLHIHCMVKKKQHILHTYWLTITMLNFYYEPNLLWIWNILSCQ
jgi:hypothetical protein